VGWYSVERRLSGVVGSVVLDGVRSGEDVGEGGEEEGEEEGEAEGEGEGVRNRILVLCCSKNLRSIPAVFSPPFTRSHRLGRRGERRPPTFGMSPTPTLLLSSSSLLPRSSTVTLRPPVSKMSTATSTASTAMPFTVAIDPKEVEELNRRLDTARWPLAEVVPILEGQEEVGSFGMGYGYAPPPSPARER
jgi:hypothetical protein